MDFAVLAFRYRAGTGLSRTMNFPVLVSAASEHHRGCRCSSSSQIADREFMVVSFMVEPDGDQLFVVAANAF